MSYAQRDSIIDPITGLHVAMTLGELIKELQEVEQALGPDVEVCTVDGTGDTREMWSAYGGTGYCELFLTSEDGS